MGEYRCEGIGSVNGGIYDKLHVEGVFTAKGPIKANYINGEGVICHRLVKRGRKPMGKVFCQMRSRLAVFALHAQRCRTAYSRAVGGNDFETVIHHPNRIVPQISAVCKQEPFSSTCIFVWNGI